MNFDLAFAYLLGDEGSKYTNNPNDAGGPTKFGITKRTYQTFFKKAVSDADIENMTEATAKHIYFDLFWQIISLGLVVPAPTAIAIFDTGVLYSPKMAVNLAQKALITCGKYLSTDGIMGAETLGFLNSVPVELFMTAYRGQILQRIATVISDHPSNNTFRHGWTNRADRLLTLIPNQTQGEIV